MHRPDSGPNWPPTWPPTDDPVENSLRCVYLRAAPATAPEARFDHLLAEITDTLRKPQRTRPLRHTA